MGTNSYRETAQTLISILLARGCSPFEIVESPSIREQAEAVIAEFVQASLGISDGTQVNEIAVAIGDCIVRCECGFLDNPAGDAEEERQILLQTIADVLRQKLEHLRTLPA